MSTCPAAYETKESIISSPIPNSINANPWSYQIKGGKLKSETSKKTRKSKKSKTSKKTRTSKKSCNICKLWN